MRLRYYLRGLGLGILFAVIVIAICGNGKKESLSDSQIMQRASELGMVSAENIKNHTLSNDTEAVNTEKVKETESPKETEKAQETQTSENGQTAADNTGNKENVADSQTSETQAAQQSTIDTGTTDTSTMQQDAATSEAAQPQYITITVTDGEVCRDIAADLQSKGLVDDAEKFRLYMGDTGYASFIHNGEFQIPVGATYEEIANILLKR